MEEIKTFFFHSNDYSGGYTLIFIVKFLFYWGSYSPGNQKRRLKVVLLKGIKKKSLGHQAFHNKKGQFNIVKKTEVWYNGFYFIEN